VSAGWAKLTENFPVFWEKAENRFNKKFLVYSKVLLINKCKIENGLY